MTPNFNNNIYLIIISIKT